MKRVLLFLGFTVLCSPLFAVDSKGVATSANDRAWVATQSVTRPWTREEMLAATPADMPELSRLELDRWTFEGLSGDVYDTSGGPGIDPGGSSSRDANPRFPRLDPVITGEVDEPGTFESGVATDSPYGPPANHGYAYPPPFTRYETFPNYTGYPHRAVGKVFFTKPGVGNFVCSASSIGGDGVITAAHCVRDGRTGAWWTNWVFVPAYYNGAAPYGQWTANHLWARGPWVNGYSGDNRFDVGGAVLNRRSGVRISTSVGWLGFMWNQSQSSTSAHFALIGYPAKAPFTGGLQYICQASFAYYGAGAPSAVGVGCDMSNGCSGGPWLRMYSKIAGSANYVNGVISYRRCIDAACVNVYTYELYSPYFDANIKSLKDCIVNSIPGNPANPDVGCTPGS
jgi:V8-like Glu-specific endopeptidase